MARPNPPVAIVSVLTTFLFGCGSEKRQKALDGIEDARSELASLARTGRSGLAQDSVLLARQALLDAESAIRREGAFIGDPPEWQPQLERALDNVEIAKWVVKRQRQAEKEEAEAWLDSASGVVDHARRTGLDGIHFAVETRLRHAEVVLDESKRLLAAEEFALATEKAREAAGLAGELPPETKALFARFGDPANLEKWRKWVRAAVSESKRTRRPALMVDKRAQMAVLWTKGKPSRWFEVELGYNGLSPKLQSGDGATPEGLYHVTRRKGRGQTKYYKALLLDYPNAEDKRRFREAKANGQLGRESSIGGLIEIHGEGGRGTNWTDGCVAVANEEMDYLFDKLKVGSAVVIVGSYEGGGDREGRTDGNE